MPVKYIPDGAGVDPGPGIDRHYYEKQLGGASPLDDSYPFRLATARAKDKARHELIRAVRKAEEDARAGGVDFKGRGLVGTDQDRAAQRSIDGVRGAPLDDIKL